MSDHSSSTSIATEPARVAVRGAGPVATVVTTLTAGLLGTGRGAGPTTTADAARRRAAAYLERRRAVLRAELDARR